MTVRTVLSARDVTRLLATTALVGIGLADAPYASAQTTTAEQTYQATDFARFAPQNAYDMLSQVPGFVIRQATVERGLGEATGNVLLNGQRISNKSDDVLAQLRRLPARNVVRIEIRDGATLGIPGLSGQVANVVSEASGVTGRWAYRPNARLRFADPLLTRFEASVSGELGPVQYTLGLENQATLGAAGGDTKLYDREGREIERRVDVWTFYQDQPRASARFVLDGPGTAVGNLNLAVRDVESEYVEDGFRQSVALPDRERDASETQDGWDYEIGGDYEFEVDGGRLKLIGLDRYSTLLFDARVLTTFADGRARIGDRLVRDAAERETIARVEYGWTAADADWRLSAEAAFNSLDSETKRYALNANGGEVEVPFPNGAAQVEEDRYEAIGTWGRTLSPRWTVQASAGMEYSRLRQIGAGGLSRAFWRPKGQINAVWQASDDLSVDFRVARQVGQLNFGDFLASANLDTGSSFTGNPNLVPAQTWLAQTELSWKHGRWGTSALRVYGERIEDIVDIVPTSATGESIGNLDEAQRYGLEYRASTDFSPMGWDGVRIDTRLVLQRSQVEDPLTKRHREISNSLKRSASVTLRHDIPQTDWAWGGVFTHQRTAQTYRLSEMSWQFEMPITSNVFVEHKNIFGLTVRAYAANVFAGESYLYRTSYAGRRTDPINFVERRDRTIGHAFGVDVRGTF